MNLRDFVSVLRECESECAFDKMLLENRLSRAEFDDICCEIREDEDRALWRKFAIYEICDNFIEMVKAQDFEALAIKAEFEVEDNTKFEQMSENMALMQRLNEFHATRWGFGWGFYLGF